jgi:hypothetical protein
MLVPINLPIKNVIAAAANPNDTWRKPENQKFLPVNNVIATPIRNNPNALTITLVTIAIAPVINRKGDNGMIAPIENNMKE